jgi:hypothetical protein
VKVKIIEYNNDGISVEVEEIECDGIVVDDRFEVYTDYNDLCVSEPCPYSGKKIMAARSSPDFLNALLIRDIDA